MPFLAYKDAHVPVGLYIFLCVCVGTNGPVRLNVHSVCVHADSALAGSAPHHTLQSTADYMALVLSSLCSVLRLLSAWERTQN